MSVREELYVLLALLGELDRSMNPLLAPGTQVRLLPAFPPPLPRPGASGGLPMAQAPSPQDQPEALFADLLAETTRSSRRYRRGHEDKVDG